MKKITFIFLLSFFIYIPEKALATVTGLDTVKAVAGIKAVFTEVNSKRKTYEQYVGEHGELPEERTAIIGFYEGENLKMISAGFFRDAGRSETEQYLIGKDLVLIYAKDYEYTASLTADPRAGTKSMVENWYYFEKGALIKWVSGGRVKPAGSAEFKKMSNQLREKNKKMLALFADKSKLPRFK